MQKQKQIQIPLDVFNDIIELLCCLGDCSCLYNDKLALLYGKIDAAIRKKRATMLYRDTFSDIIHAKDDSSRNAARENYLATRQLYSDLH